MSITRLQQARQMYAMGQRVAKTIDGSRPGYRGDRGYQGGATNQGGAGNPGSGSGSGGGNGGGNRPETERYNPHTDSGTSKTSVATGDEIRSANRDFIQTLNTNNAIRAAQTGTKFNPNNFMTTFAPKEQKKFGIMDLVMIAASGGLLGPKIATGAKMFNTAKNISKFANNIGLTDTNVIDSFTSNFSDKFNNFDKGTTTKNNTINNTINNGGGEGITSLENQAGNYDEYILLLQKLQTGNISDAERNRYNVLKSNLGI